MGDQSSSASEGHAAAEAAKRRLENKIKRAISRGTVAQLAAVVGGLPHEADEEWVAQIFAAFGGVLRPRLPRERADGTAFVTFESGACSAFSHTCEAWPHRC